MTAKMKRLACSLGAGVDFHKMLAGFVPLGLAKMAQPWFMVESSWYGVYLMH